MNINKELVNRALEAAGQEQLNEEEIENNSARWRLIKDNYLAVILTTLSKTSWACATTRRQLVEDEETENQTEYGYKYFLPVDCAKAEALSDNSEYIIEGNYLYTNTPEAVLVFVSNGKIESDIESRSPEYEQPPIIETPEDYPGYAEPNLDDKLKEYIELQLAAKIALKITGDKQTFQLLYSQAVVIEDNVRKASLEHAHSKEQGEEWWGDRIGLSVEGK